MEDVLNRYAQPFDPEYPMICMDEASRQLIGQVVSPLAPQPGQPALQDFGYVRNGVCNLFSSVNIRIGWRRVIVTERRTKQEWAQAIRTLIDVEFPAARRIRLVLDNLNTHVGGALYETFPPDEARRLMQKLEFRSRPSMRVRSTWPKSRSVSSPDNVSTAASMTEIS